MNINKLDRDINKSIIMRIANLLTAQYLINISCVYLNDFLSNYCLKALMNSFRNMKFIINFPLIIYDYFI